MTWNETHGWRHHHASRSHSSCWSITMQQRPLRSLAQDCWMQQQYVQPRGAIAP